MPTVGDWPDSKLAGTQCSVLAYRDHRVHASAIALGQLDVDDR